MISDQYPQKHLISVPHQQKHMISDQYPEKHMISDQYPQKHMMIYSTTTEKDDIKSISIQTHDIFGVLKLLCVSLKAPTEISSILR